MTCKDNCLYSPVCRLPFNTAETQVEFAEVCHHFKNKADVVEVVFCKDCKHCEHFYPECDINGNCREAYYCKSIKGDVKPTDYCCWGERRCEE